MYERLFLSSECKLPEGSHGILYFTVQGLRLGAERKGRRGKESGGEGREGERREECLVAQL